MYHSFHHVTRPYYVASHLLACCDPLKTIFYLHPTHPLHFLSSFSPFWLLFPHSPPLYPSTIHLLSLTSALISQIPSWKAISQAIFKQWSYKRMYHIMHLLRSIRCSLIARTYVGDAGKRRTLFSTSSGSAVIYRHFGRMSIVLLENVLIMFYRRTSPLSFCITTTSLIRPTGAMSCLY